MAGFSELVWVPDNDYEWRLAEVVQRDEKLSSMTVNYTDRSLSITEYGQSARKPGQTIASSVETAVAPSSANHSKSQVFPYHESHSDDMDELCSLYQPHEAPIINILRRRWMKNQIYTNIGDILISINPYKQISGLYAIPTIFYKTLSKVIAVPHIYVTAKRALECLKNIDVNTHSRGRGNFNQSIIINGESGAGKTEASKYLVHYLVNANNYDHGGKSHDLRDMILNSTIVLEAFGNAVTVQNHNSSRFGKYLKLNYSIKNELISTSTETFLLEKSRVVKLGKGERNYHIFYRLVYGLQVMFPDLSAQLCLTNISDFRILHNSDSDMNIDGSVEAREFSRLYDAMLDVRCKESDLKQLWTILAAILHLGNVDFISSSSDNLLHMQCTSTTTSNISEMLGLAEDELDRALATHIISTRGGTSVKVKLLNVIEVNNNIQGLIKRLYQSVFSWILQSINQYDDDREIQLQSEKFIGILDIFGFEVLQVNSFEQLCINYASERLQQQFNDWVFASEQQLYEREGIHWTAISYHNNQNIIDLIAKKPNGMLYIIDEKSKMNRFPDDATLLNQFHQLYSSEKIYVKSRFGNDLNFTINHYAGSVTYNIEGFIVKNNDALQEDISELMKSSTNSFLQYILSINDYMTEKQSNPTSAASANASLAFDPSPRRLVRSNTDDGQTQRIVKPLAMASSSTLSSSLRVQLDHLIHSLSLTQPHYIKCIKPNASQTADEFQSSYTITQLRYSDIVELVRIQQEKYTIRYHYDEFHEKYDILLRIQGIKKVDNNRDHKKYCQYILDKYLEKDVYQYGKTYIFLRKIGYNKIQETIQQLVARHIITVQKNVRRYLVYCRMNRRKHKNELLKETTIALISLTNEDTEELSAQDLSLHPYQLKTNDSSLGCEVPISQEFNARKDPEIDIHDEQYAAVPTKPYRDVKVDVSSHEETNDAANAAGLTLANPKSGSVSMIEGIMGSLSPVTPTSTSSSSSSPTAAVSTTHISGSSPFSKSIRAALATPGKRGAGRGLLSPHSPHVDSENYRRLQEQRHREEALKREQEEKMIRQSQSKQELEEKFRQEIESLHLQFEEAKRRGDVAKMEQLLYKKDRIRAQLVQAGESYLKASFHDDNPSSKHK